MGDKTFKIIDNIFKYDIDYLENSGYILEELKKCSSKQQFKVTFFILVKNRYDILKLLLDKNILNLDKKNIEVIFGNLILNNNNNNNRYDFFITFIKDIKLINGVSHSNISMLYDINREYFNIFKKYLHNRLNNEELKDKDKFILLKVLKLLYNVEKSNQELKENSNVNIDS